MIGKSRKHDGARDEREKGTKSKNREGAKSTSGGVKTAGDLKKKKKKKKNKKQVKNSRPAQGVTLRVAVTFKRSTPRKKSSQKGGHQWRRQPDAPGGLTSLRLQSPRSSEKQQLKRNQGGISENRMRERKNETLEGAKATIQTRLRP